MQKLRKCPGYLILEVCLLSSVLLLYIAMFYVFSLYRFNAQREISQDSLIASSLACFTAGNTGISGNDVTITDIYLALTTIKNHLAYNFPQDRLGFIKSRINLEKFIIYNVIGDDITINEYNDSTDIFSISYSQNSKGILKTPKGNTVSGTTIHAKISYLTDIAPGRSMTVYISNDVDVRRK